MKRIKVAIFLLVFAAIVCVTEFLYVTNLSDNIIKQIEDIESAYENEESDKALELTEKLNTNWAKHVKKIDMLLYHDYVDAISINLAQLRIYIKEEDSVGLHSTCKQAIMQLNSLKLSEIPNAENII